MQVLVLNLCGLLSSRLADKAVKEYAVYRSSLLFWGLVDLIYEMFKVRDRLFLNQFIYLLAYLLMLCCC